MPFQKCNKEETKGGKGVEDKGCMLLISKNETHMEKGIKMDGIERSGGHVQTRSRYWMPMSELIQVMLVMNTVAYTCWVKTKHQIHIQVLR